MILSSPNIFANPFEFYSIFVVLSHSFADVQRKGLVGITLEFFLLNSVKWDIRKMGWKMGLVPPCRNYLVSIAVRTMDVATVLPLQYLQCTVIIVDNMC